MGLYDRDYYRAGVTGQEIPPVCKWLIIATVVVFLLQIFITRPMRPEDLRWPYGPPIAPGPDSGERPAPDTDQDEPHRDMPDLALLPRVSLVEEWLQLDPNEVLRHGQVWRLVTCAFCHDRFGVWHILINMLFLYWFGRMLEPLYGSREFLLFYLAAAVVSSLSYIGLDLFTHESAPAIGASGAVMAVVVLYAIHHPRERIYVFMMIPVEIRWLVLLYVVYDLHPVLLALSGSPVQTGVAHAAHLGGAAFGFVYWRHHLRLEDWLDRVRQWRKLRPLRLRPRLRVYRPSEPPSEAAPREDLEGLVDKILAKIHEEGQSSLTEVERELLRMAGERYRKRPGR